MAPHPTPLAGTPDKAALRAAALARRDGLDPAFRRRASERIAARAMVLPELAGGEGPVGAYWPIRGEVDPRPLLDALVARGRAVALPRVRDRRLDFRCWHPGDPLVPGAFGVMEPGPDAPACPPAALLVPLAAFDARGHRIGYGAGCFDRALAAAEGRPLALGLAFAAQAIPRVPNEPHDRRLDAVVTEDGVLRPREGS